VQPWMECAAGRAFMAAKAIDIGLWGDLTIDPAVSLVASDQASNIVIDVNCN